MLCMIAYALPLITPIGSIYASIYFEKLHLVFTLVGVHDAEDT